MLPPRQACSIVTCGAHVTFHCTGIPKLDDANDAGGRCSNNCTLILTEGDSAKTLAISGLSVIGRDHYGVFPLRYAFPLLPEFMSLSIARCLLALQMNSCVLTQISSACNMQFYLACPSSLSVGGLSVLF